MAYAIFMHLQEVNFSRTKESALVKFKFLYWLFAASPLTFSCLTAIGVWKRLLPSQLSVYKWIWLDCFSKDYFCMIYRIWNSLFKQGAKFSYENERKWFFLFSGEPLVGIDPEIFLPKTWSALRRAVAIRQIQLNRFRRIGGDKEHTDKHVCILLP